jgi:hypothetical protein
MNVISKLFSRFRKEVAPQVVIHDADASQPHNLDEPFLNESVQARIGNAISSSTRKADVALDDDTKRAE